MFNHYFAYQHIHRFIGAKTLANNLHLRNSLNTEGEYKHFTLQTLLQDHIIIAFLAFTQSTVKSSNKFFSGRYLSSLHNSQSLSAECFLMSFDEGQRQSHLHPCSILFQKFNDTSSSSFKWSKTRN